LAVLLIMVVYWFFEISPFDKNPDGKRDSKQLELPEVNSGRTLRQERELRANGIVYFHRVKTTVRTASNEWNRSELLFLSNVLTVVLLYI
jgi:hypothetical protein